jgi:alanyl-tRNA synthetase
MGHQFPELRQQQTLIERVIEEEEASFLRTLATGINLLDRVIAKVGKGGVIAGKDAFELYDTFGFPIDLTELIAREQGVNIDLEGFEKELQAQKERSRNAAAQDIDDWQEVMPISQCEFVGYDTLTAPIHIARYRKVTSKGKTTFQLVFDQTPFYGNAGGQIGDTGYIESANEKIQIVATEKENGLIIHVTTTLPENIEAEFTAVVDAEARQAAANNHTATHLLDQALRKVLGTHVEQKGSMVSPSGLRFDFSHFQKVTAEELREVERMVNQLIRENNPLEENREATMDEANAMGAIALFGEKYGDKVRIVNFGPSTELCGGTHTSATGTIGIFKIVSESAISAGVRRIEAVTGDAAEALVYEAQDTISAIEQIVRSPKLVQAVEKMVENNAQLSREIEEMRKEKVAQVAATIATETEVVNGIKLIKRTTTYTSEVMKDLAFALRSRVAEGLVMVIGNLNDGKPTINIMLSDDIVAKGVDAGATVREAAKLINGGGGGQKHYATAGGKNPEALEAAVEKAVELIMSKLN